MSSRSSFVVISLSLHLVEGIGESGFESEGFLDLLGGGKGILTVLQKTRAMVIAHELDEGGSIGLPVRWESLEILENRVQPRRPKERYRIFSVLVEVGIEDTHVLEIGVALDLEEVPAQVVQLENRESIRLCRNGVLDVGRVLVELTLPTRNDLRYDRKTVAGRAPRKDRAVTSLLDFVRGVSPFWYRLCSGFRPVLFLRGFCHVDLLSKQ